MVRKIRQDWSGKVWWVHGEAPYTTLLGYELTKKLSLFELYERIRDYTFKTFPNPNGDMGEWIKIRDREGNFANKVVALPVKDPLHITQA